MDQNQNAVLFVGYLTLEEWLRAVDKKRPVFAVMTATDETMSYIVRREIVIEVAQPENVQAMVHYCRILAGRMSFMGDSPVESDHPVRTERAQGLMRIIETWLEEKGLTVLHGAIATPIGMQFVKGWADFVTLDKATQMFVWPAHDAQEALDKS
jgi:hypothetical protein